MSPSLLSTRLRSLERAGVIKRIEKDGHVRYQLSKSGSELVQIIWQLGTWGQRWVRSDLSKDDLDPSMLVWDIHRTLDSSFFEGDRTVIKFEFTDYTSKLRYWWIVIQEGDVDVCLKDQGYEVDLTVSSDLRTLTAVWMGEISITKSMREEKLILTGSSYLKKNIRFWLGTNYYADVKRGKMNQGHE